MRLNISDICDSRSSKVGNRIDITQVSVGFDDVDSEETQWTKLITFFSNPNNHRFSDIYKYKRNFQSPTTADLFKVSRNYEWVGKN